MSAAVDGEGRDRTPDTGAPKQPVPRPATDDRALSPMPSLKAALRTARADEAERSRAIADLRGAELARLEILRDMLEPVLAQVPEGVDLFDTALMPGPRPRLFIDMIGFVEMAHDKRQYRFIQDTREGRVVLCESDRLSTISDAVTAYIARRLIEREKALASTALAAASAPSTASRAARSDWRSWLRRAGRLVLEYLGIVMLVVLFWVLGHALYQWAISPPR